MGHPDEIGIAAFPLITHIDLFLLLGIFKKGLGNRLYLKSNLLLVIVSILFLISSAINLVTATEIQEVLLLVAGLFPLRYLLLVLLLLSNYDIKLYERQVVFSLIASIFFLFFESLVNTQITNPNELASGTLGSNTFANVTVSILMFFIFIKRNHFPISNILFILFVSCATLIILMTGTRIAIVAGAITFLILQAYLFNWYKLAVVIVSIGIIAVTTYNYVDVPDRYSFKHLASKIHFQGFSVELENVIIIEQSQETSSVVTRLKLYRAALYMLFDNPAWGTGYGTFNYLKGQYGFNIPVLIDAHNGYLSTLAQLGFSSVFFLYLIYLYPILNFKEFKDQSFLASLAIINLTMAVCDLSNAGIYKHPVFALLVFNGVVISMFKKEKSQEASFK